MRIQYTTRMHLSIINACARISNSQDGKKYNKADELTQALR